MYCLPDMTEHPLSNALLDQTEDDLKHDVGLMRFWSYLLLGGGADTVHKMISFTAGINFTADLWLMFCV